MAVLFRNADITIYNKYYDSVDDVDRYQRTIITGVNWQDERNATVSDKGLLLADSILIFIDKLDNYVSPRVFRNLSSAERMNYFTFAAGDKIVKGEIDFEILGLRPYSVADLENNYDDVVNIMSIRELSQHWEVEAK